jgi:sulfoxide reductase heme-binding subunit YedZ
MWKFNTASTANILGFLALSSYIFTLLPTCLRVVFPPLRKTKLPVVLLKFRRQLGILAFLLALGHAWILINKRDLDFLDLKTYEIYIQGISTFLIFTLLAATSNDWSVKKLKKNWRRLHQLTYLAMFLLAWHIYDKMFDQWSFVTPLAIIGLLTTIILFLTRRYLEWQEVKIKEDKSYVSAANIKIID